MLLQMLGLLSVSSLVSFGCSSDSSSNSLNNQSDQSQGDPQPNADNPPHQKPKKICEPSLNLGCVKDYAPEYEECSADGFKKVRKSCSQLGAIRLCVKGTCHKALCHPGTGRCSTGGGLETCAPDGESWLPEKPCKKGSVCREGACLDACGIANYEKSYIGCDYWAFALDNPLLWYSSHDQKVTLQDNERPPYAIVLANTSTTYGVYVNVYKGVASFATLIDKRTVGISEPDPEVTLKTVYSEVVDLNGTVTKRLSGKAERLVLPPRSTMTLLLKTPKRPRLGSSLSTGSYHVVTSRPVVAYQFNPLCCNYSYTNDASLLLPTSTLTGRYTSLAYPTWGGSVFTRNSDANASNLSIVATDYDTKVRVRFSSGVQPATVLPGLNYASIKGMQWDSPGRIFEAVLQPHEVLNLGAMGILPPDDLTGTEVYSDKPIAVFSGHACTFYPFSVAACDHVESQLLPRETWSTHLVATPLKGRGQLSHRSREATYFKFMAEENNTEINVGISIQLPNVLGAAGEGTKSCIDFATDAAAGKFTLQAHQYCEFGTNQPFEIMANKPIQVGAMLSGQNSVQGPVAGKAPPYSGDPALFVLAPVEQYRSDYSFFAPPTYKFNYATVIAQKGATFSLDEKEIDLDDSTYQATAVPNTQWIRYHLPVKSGPHRLISSQPVGLVVYGYHNYVSYAYTGGLDLTKLRDLKDSF